LDEFCGQNAGFQGLARPTASAIKMRLWGWRSACQAGSNW
jgi:hypothetical protein